mmetsp:Transcript_18622/g.37733  ORF Transcript_18622/g.37733 Transcript_18622/m.37733 type:complete len:271 (-) Transcript_18622:228-1040(-)
MSQPFPAPLDLIESGISLLDSFGASSWSLRAVAFTTAALLLVMRKSVGEAAGIEWHAFFHAAVTGFGAWACQILDDASREEWNGENGPGIDPGLDPCGGPPTSLHRLLPALTLGYSICDILDSLKLGPAFLLHGLATAFVMAVFCELEQATHLVTPMLLMEISTIPLATLRAKFYSETLRTGISLLFVFTFFVVRILWVPPIWFAIVKVLRNEKLGAGADSCQPLYLLPLVLIFGIFFNCLNGYWFIKMILKIKRKISGKEASSNVEMTE